MEKLKKSAPRSRAWAQARAQLWETGVLGCAVPGCSCCLAQSFCFCPRLVIAPEAPPGLADHEALLDAVHLHAPRVGVLGLGDHAPALHRDGPHHGPVQPVVLRRHTQATRLKHRASKPQGGGFL